MYLPFVGAVADQARGLSPWGMKMTNGNSRVTLWITHLKHLLPVLITTLLAGVTHSQSLVISTVAGGGAGDGSPAVLASVYEIGRAHV